MLDHGYTNTTTTTTTTAVAGGQVEARNNPEAIAGFVMAVTGTIFSLIPVMGALLLLFALFVSGSGLVDSLRPAGTYKGLAVAGLSIATPMFILASLVSAFFFV